MFAADKVTTPLLIMHDKEDSNVPFSQEGEWFSALNHLGRKVWLLSYAGESHTIKQLNNQLDYSNKLAAFFDHFLKGYPVPEWMDTNQLAR